MSTNWMLIELDAPHEQILIDFHAGENDTPEYRAINPMGKLPCLEDDGVGIYFGDSLLIRNITR